ncbi:MAG TPA: CotH kinase family protein [Verrucomicrobiae bacterium]|nr:CotH kinase family protein [Verrucomicrobiae bacterium]
MPKSRIAKRTAPVTLLPLLAAVGLNAELFRAPAHAAPAPTPGHELFAAGPIRTFKVELTESALATLKKNERAYVPATVTEGGTVFKEAGVHLKGMGSFQPFQQKPSLAVKFDKYTPDQRYLGLSKIFLNNSAQDSTYLAELMSTQMFRDAGLPAARVTQAFVELNGRKLGLYVLIEAMNKDFLRQYFKNAKGNLYEAYLQDIDQQLDLDGGTDDGQADRKRLLEICNISNPAERWSRLPEVLDVDKYLSHCVLEMFVAHTDGYALNRNNYRLYHDPSTDRFTMIPHGLDWGFLNAGAPVQPPPNSIITRAVLGTPEGRKAFRERRSQLFTQLYRLDLFSNRVDKAVANLKTGAHDESEAKQFDDYGREMIRRIAARYQVVSNQLAAPEPQPLRFDAAGVAQLTGWRPLKRSGDAVLDLAQSEGRSVLHIKSAGEGAVASWRLRVSLPAGQFRFTGDARAERLVVDSNDPAAGAGLRISGGKLAGKLTGDAAWTTLEHSFEAAYEGEEKELVCELRARQGEVWFDAQSLRLIRAK